MVRSLIEGVMDIINAFPSKNSISDTISPATIVEGKPKLDFSKPKISFGSYALVYTQTTNDMKTRAVPGIALRASNSAGGHYFMSLYSGKRIHGYKWEELPVDEYVIERVESLADQEKQPIMHKGMPSFEWAPGIDIIDELEEADNDLLQIPDGAEANIVQPAMGIEPAVEEEVLLEIEDQLVEREVGVQDGELPPVDEGDVHEIIDEQVDNEGLMVVHNNNIVSEEEDFVEEDDDEEEGQTDEDVDEPAVVADLDDLPERESNSRPRRENAGAGVDRLQMAFAGKGYSSKREFNLVTNGKIGKPIECNDEAKTFMDLACNIIFAQVADSNDPQRYSQMTAKAGFKKFGQEAVAAMIKEFTQLNEGAVPGKPVVIPTDVKSLTALERKKALRAVNLIKEKRSGDIKGRTCVNGSGQRKYLKQDESVASPTAALESLIVTLLIDAYEERDVAVYDVPGSYLHATLSPTGSKERALMKLEGDFVDIMVKVNPEHAKNVIYEHGKKVLYMEILQAIYGCIESALRWYELYSETLVKEGFKINPYDKCVANKLINGKQCTIVWYVDDNKVSHVDNQVVTEVIEIMKGHFGDLVVTRGKTHNFLGMNIHINDEKNIEIEMKDQLKEAVATFEAAEGECVNETVTSPAQKHLRDTNDDCEMLTGVKHEVFHSVVAKILYIMKRARPDLETAVSYLCTRVSKSDLDDWKKLRRVIAFIKVTIDDKRIIGASHLSSIFMWIDAAYAVNPDMKSQTGGTMSMGIGVLHRKCSKQKLNVKSSTEAELVGVSEYIPYNIWLLSFMDEQGYTVKNNILFQDNQSTILMLKNGRNSCTGNSRHVNIRYFFVKDRIDKKEVRVEYCPTEIMLADFFTKALQGRLFLLFRSVIMGYQPISILNNPHL